MSQSINLDNISTVIFDWAPVDKIYLNGSMIWEGMVTVNIWGSLGVFSADKAVGESAAGLIGPIVNINDNSNYLTFNWTTTSYPTPSSQNPYYKGSRIIAAFHRVIGGLDATVPAANSDGDIFGAGTMFIGIEGIHPQNFFSSVSVNGRLYNTSAVVSYIPANNISHIGLTLPNRTFTEWAWDPHDEGAPYALFNQNTNNVLEFR